MYRKTSETTEKRKYKSFKHRFSDVGLERISVLTLPEFRGRVEGMNLRLEKVLEMSLKNMDPDAKIWNITMGPYRTEIGDILIKVKGVYKSDDLSKCFDYDHIPSN